MRPITDRFVETVKAIAPTFGGINLEDIKAPECFEIEARLREALDIPVMHDDQHGTAIISGAALLNGLEIAGKSIADARVVINGAGAAAVSIARLFLKLGLNCENLVLCDSKGVVSTRREDLNPVKEQLATGPGRRRYAGRRPPRCRRLPRRFSPRYPDARNGPHDGPRPAGAGPGQPHAGDHLRRGDGIPSGHHLRNGPFGLSQSGKQRGSLSRTFSGVRSMYMPVRSMTK